MTLKQEPSTMLNLSHPNARLDGQPRRTLAAPVVGAFLALSLLALTGCTEPEENHQEPQPEQTDADAGSDMLATTGDLGDGSDGGAEDMTPGEEKDLPTSVDMPDAPQDMGPGEDQGEDQGSPAGLAMFVAQGEMGRTIISCDDGQTWVADQSWDKSGHALVCGMAEPSQCYSPDHGCSFLKDGSCERSESDCDCNHHPGAARGITWGQGYFVATFGWGPKGGVFRSEDGQSWENVIEDTTFANVAYGQGTFLTGSRRPQRSTDGGATWSQSADADLRAPNGETVHNPRTLTFVDVLGGRFVLTGESGEKRDVLVSADAGDSWSRPDPLPDTCSNGVRGVAGGDGKIIIANRNDEVCLSTDGGASFSLHPLGDSGGSKPLYDGEKFVLYGRGHRLKSSDGKSWSVEELSPGNLQLGSIAINPTTGTLVAINGGWKQWYDKQRFYRSSDGLNWTELPEDSYSKGHGIRGLTFGWAAAGTTCP